MVPAAPGPHGFPGQYRNDQGPDRLGVGFPNCHEILPECRHPRLGRESPHALGQCLVHVPGRPREIAGTLCPMVNQRGSAPIGPHPIRAAEDLLQPARVHTLHGGPGFPPDPPGLGPANDQALDPGAVHHRNLLNDPHHPHRTTMHRLCDPMHGTGTSLTYQRIRTDP